MSDTPMNGVGGASGSHDCHADCVPSYGGEINALQTAGNRAAAMALLQRNGDGAANNGPTVPSTR